MHSHEEFIDRIAPHAQELQRVTVFYRALFWTSHLGV